MCLTHITNLRSNETFFVQQTRQCDGWEEVGLSDTSSLERAWVPMQWASSPWPCSWYHIERMVEYSCWPGLVILFPTFVFLHLLGLWWEKMARPLSQLMKKIAAAPQLPRGEDLCAGQGSIMEDDHTQMRMLRRKWPGGEGIKRMSSLFALAHFFLIHQSPWHF